MKIKTTKQIFDFLPGKWKIIRNIRSGAAPENIKADGYGSFALYPDTTDIIPLFKLNLTNEFQHDLAQNMLIGEHKVDAQNSLVHSKMRNGIILYSEEVIIHNSILNANTIGRQKYQYKYDTTTSSLSKHFNDGGFFYNIEISDHKIGGRHLCIRDTYVATYMFEDNKFTLSYHVHGPSKNYEITTQYSKVMGNKS
jgi:RPE3 domain-containing protein